MKASASAAPARACNENFTVRKISYGEGVERVFPLYSPMLDSIKIVRRGKVRRAKLYYLRGLRGKSARIVEKTEHRPVEGRGRAKKAAAGKPANNSGAHGSSDLERPACPAFFYDGLLPKARYFPWPGQAIK